MNTSRIALIAVASSAVLAMAACGSDTEPDTPDATVSTTSSASSSEAEDSSTSESPSTSSSTSPSSDSAGDDGLAAVAAAVDAAESKTGGTAYEVDDQDDDGSWEIDLAKGTKSIEVEVSADGKVTEQERDDLDQDDRAALDSAQITITEAIEKALDEVEGTFDEAELEEEGGTYYWEVSVDTGGDDDREVYVDVVTGKVSLDP